MATQKSNNIVLGMFVITGVILLVFALYMIGRNQSFFGSNYLLKARFKNVAGLMPGNNVRFSGIQCGTVKNIEIIDDTTIEVSLLVSSKTCRYIRKNAIANIGNEGLMGNKIINIEPGKTMVPAVTDGDYLLTAQGKSLNDMLSALSATNDNTTEISESLKEVANKLNNNPVLWTILTDTTIPENLRSTLVNVQRASQHIAHAAATADELLTDVKNGKGTAGLLLTDQGTAKKLTDAVAHIQSAASGANLLVSRLDSVVQDIHIDANKGGGTVHMLLKDTGLVNRLNNSVGNIEKGTAAFSEDMEALKHNFFLRGYFRRQEKAAKKAAEQQQKELERQQKEAEKAKQQ